MSRREKILIVVCVILALLVLFSIPVKVARSQEQINYSQQFAFHVDHEDRPGVYTLEPKEVRIAYTIEPADEAHPAPFLIDSTTICRTYNVGPKLFLKCGMDSYKVLNIGLVPKKGK